MWFLRAGGLSKTTVIGLQSKLCKTMTSIYDISNPYGATVRAKINSHEW